MPRDIEEEDAQWTAEGKEAEDSSEGKGEEKGDRSSRSPKSKKKGTILERAIAYCWDDEFLNVFRAYFVKHAHLFEAIAHKDSSSERELEGVEHDLEFTELFQDYLKLFEGTLEKFIEKEGSDIKDFYEEVKEAQKHSKDPRELEFVDALLASADYDSFYKVMVREARRQKFLRDFEATSSPSTKK